MHVYVCVWGGFPPACPFRVSHRVSGPGKGTWGWREERGQEEDSVVTGDKATNEAVPSLMTVRVSLRETLGPRLDAPPRPANGRPQSPSRGRSRGVCGGQSLAEGPRRTLLLAGELCG